MLRDFGKQYFKLNVTDNTLVQQTNAGVSGDANSRALEVTVTNARGEVLATPELKLNLICKVSEEEIYLTEGVYEDNGTYTLPYPSEIFNKAQRVKCMVQLVDHESNQVMFTKKFTRVIDEGFFAFEGGDSIAIDFALVMDFANTYEEKMKALQDLVDDETVEMVEQSLKILEEFNLNATVQLDKFNENAIEKTDAYNTNASNLEKAYNNNAKNSLEEYNNNAKDKIDVYNINAKDKLENLNTVVDTSLEEYNANASKKVEEYNVNTVDKTDVYNVNATAKVKEYDTNAKSKLEAYNSNSTEKFEAFNVNAQETEQSLIEIKDETEQARDTTLTAKEDFDKKYLTINEALANEETRKEEELERIENEKIRVTNEEVRQSEEKIRIENEINRNLGEENREERFDSMVDKGISEEVLNRLNEKINPNLVTNVPKDFIKIISDANSTRIFLGGSDAKFYLTNLKVGDKICISATIKFGDVQILDWANLSYRFKTQNGTSYIATRDMQIGKELKNTTQEISIVKILTDKDLENEYLTFPHVYLYRIGMGDIEVGNYKVEKGTDTTSWIPSIFEVEELKVKGITKSEVMAEVNILNGKINDKIVEQDNKFITKAEFAKLVGKERKLETLAGLILEELRKSNPDIGPIDVNKLLEVENEEK